MPCDAVLPPALVSPVCAPPPLRPPVEHTAPALGLLHHTRRSRARWKTHGLVGLRVGCTQRLLCTFARGTWCNRTEVSFHRKQLL